MSTLYTSILLDGTWEMDYTPDAYKSEKLPEAKFYRIEDAVPGYWEDMCDKFRRAPFFCFLRVNPEYGLQRYPIADVVPDMALPNIIGCFFYRRTFNVADATLPSVLAFEGAQNAVSAWINGCYIGRHEGYSAPFDMEIPAQLLNEGENTVVLAVSNHRLEGYNNEPVSGVTSRAACECTGGLYGSVELRQYTTPLRDVYVTTERDLTAICVHVESTEPVTYTWTLLDGKKELRSGEATGDILLSANDLEKWAPDNPKLYTIKIADGKSEITRRFGVRRLTVDSVQLRLNGEYICPRGICEHGYFPLTAHPCRDKNYYRKIVKTLKQLGFNFVRFHTHVPMPEYIEAADELGVIMHIESPNNTSLAEWCEIVRYCRRYTAPVIYCCGNELLMDDPFIEHQAKCADEVHKTTDALFSPMSAMRGVEYMWAEKGIEKETVDVPFRHHPRRLKRLAEFCDLYSSYANGKLSYSSLDADWEQQDVWSDVYNKPRLTHEICIHGTYADLSIKDRYRGTRIGETELFTSVEKHLTEVGLIDRAPTYYRNSSEWQRRLRKHCFEACRRCTKLAGYDYLGDIDHHWHTFGYNVGMMNEFYELKPGETVRNVRMYNSDAVLLCGLKTDFNFTSGEKLDTEIAVSNFGKEIPDSVLRVRIIDRASETTLYRKTLKIGDVKNGFVGKIHNLCVTLPKIAKPMPLMLSVTLSGGSVDVENEWELYVFPKPEKVRIPASLTVLESTDPKKLMSLMNAGRDVVLFASNEADLPFASQATSFRMSLAGRTHGYLATVIADHPSMSDMPNEGFCGWQFRRLLEGGRAVRLGTEVPFDPIIDVANTHKNAQRLASLFEYCVIGEKGKIGRLLVCTLKFNDTDPAASWLKSALLKYAASEDFAPKYGITTAELDRLFTQPTEEERVNTNFAYNPNDKTMKRIK